MTPPATPTIQMFDTLAEGYDAFNRASSLGLDAVWRARVLRDVHPGMRVLDLGTGTGDLALGASERVDPGGTVIALDASLQMLKKAKQKALKSTHASLIQWVHRGAEEIPFEPEPYDVVLSGFVLRNLASTVESILQGVYRSLRSGGRVSFVDLTEPDAPWVKRGADLYFLSAVSTWGHIYFKKSEPIRYLRNSMRSFLNAQAFHRLLKDTGFVHVEARRMLFGMVTHYRGVKP